MKKAGSRTVADGLPREDGFAAAHGDVCVTSWAEFSLSCALRGMEDESTPAYSATDLRVVFPDEPPAR